MNGRNGNLAFPLVKISELVLRIIAGSGDKQYTCGPFIGCQHGLIPLIAVCMKRRGAAVDINIPSQHHDPSAFYIHSFIVIPNEIFLTDVHAIACKYYSRIQSCVCSERKRSKG